MQIMKYRVLFCAIGLLGACDGSDSSGQAVVISDDSNSLGPADVISSLDGQVIISDVADIQDDAGGVDVDSEGADAHIFDGIGTDQNSHDTGGDVIAGEVDSAGKLGRLADPVVLLGAQLPTFHDVLPGNIVGFARRDNLWVQVPVQVDERVVQDFCEIYGKSSGLWTDSPACKTSSAITALFYADLNTFTGPDTNPYLDNDDEVVFMARDAGDRILYWEDPEQVISGSGVELELTDGDSVAYLYLFIRSGTVIEPAADTQYVTYDFALDGGADYLTGYDLYGYSCGGFNATCDPSMLEDSTVQGANYTRHFSARWVTDELRITAGDATGVDILDIHQNRFGPSSCGRHVLTYSTAEGAYVVNKNGPIRAIRSYLGANSGPLTQRVHYFYDKREDITTHLRVHALSIGVMDVFDYSENALGMVYYNDLNPGGLTIDGIPDAADESGLHQWEFVTGPQGSLVMTGLLDTSLDLGFAHFFWADNKVPSFGQCDTSTLIDAPDTSAYGTSGAWLDGALPDTDPKNGASDHIMVTRTIYYREPGISLDEALSLVVGAQAPVTVSTRTVGVSALGSACGDGECETDEACPLDCVPIDGSCGDGICLPPENSVSCFLDCPAGTGEDVVCGDGVCDQSVENQLSCATDCWPPYSDAVSCVDSTCAGSLDACADEAGCVALVVCVGPCVASGTAAYSCITSCSDSLMSSQIDVQTAQQMLLCGSTNGCF